MNSQPQAQHSAAGPSMEPDREHGSAPLGTDPLFDPEDQAASQYEMLRHREVERAPILQRASCREFGYTQEGYRHLLERFRSEGIAGLFERKRDRRHPLNANDPVRRWLRHEHAHDPSLGPEDGALLVVRSTGCLPMRKEKKTSLEENASPLLRVMAFSARAASASELLIVV